MRFQEFVTERHDQIQLGPQLFVSRQTTTEGIKPRGVAWTSTAQKTDQGFTSDWIEWCKDNMAHWVTDTGILYDVAPGARILLVRTDRDLIRVARRYGLEIKNSYELFKKMDWDVLRQDYDAVHHIPRGRDYFMGTWDVESTAWFDRKFLTNPRRVKVNTGKTQNIRETVKPGVAEAASSSYADEHGYVAEFVDKIGDMDYEFKITNIRTGNSGHYVIRPVGGQLSGRIQIDSMDVKDLQSGKAFHLSSGGLSRGGWDFDSSFFDAINALVYDNDQLQREIWQLFMSYDKFNDAALDSGADGWRVPLMPGLSQRQPGTRSITATDLFRAQDASRAATQQAMQAAAGKKQAKPRK